MRFAPIPARRYACIYCSGYALIDVRTYLPQYAPDLAPLIQKSIQGQALDDQEHRVWSAPIRTWA